MLQMDYSQDVSIREKAMKYLAVRELLQNDEGTQYSWYFEVDGIYYDVHQNNDKPIVILVNNYQGDLDLANLPMSEVEWLRQNNIQLVKE